MKNSKVTKKKREEFLRKSNAFASKQFIAIAAVISFVLTLVISAYVFGGKHPNSRGSSLSSKGPIEMTPIKAEEVDDYLEIALNQVKDKNLVFFEYEKVNIPEKEGGERPLPLLAYIAPSGRVVTAVSMCEPCSSFYFHIEQGNILVCNVCGTRWNLEDLSAVAGACGSYPPFEVPNEIEGNTVKIKSADLASWKPRK